MFTCMALRMLALTCKSTAQHCRAACPAVLQSLVYMCFAQANTAGANRTCQQPDMSAYLHIERYWPVCLYCPYVERYWPVCLYRPCIATVAARNYVPANTVALQQLSEAAEQCTTPNNIMHPRTVAQRRHAMAPQGSCPLPALQPHLTDSRSLDSSRFGPWAVLLSSEGGSCAVDASGAAIGCTAAGTGSAAKGVRGTGPCKPPVAMPTRVAMTLNKLAPKPRSVVIAKACVWPPGPGVVRPWLLLHWQVHDCHTGEPAARPGLWLH
jgi:hypothetical protein